MDKTTAPTSQMFHHGGITTSDWFSDKLSISIIRFHTPSTESNKIMFSLSLHPSFNTCFDSLIVPQSRCVKLWTPQQVSRQENLLRSII